MKGAIALLAAAAAVIAGGAGLMSATWHLSYGRSLYCALGTASTVGCDVNPPGTAARWAAAALMLTAIPLLATASARLFGLHVRRHTKRLLDEHHRLIREHIDRVTGGGQQ